MAHPLPEGFTSLQKIHDDYSIQNPGWSIKNSPFVSVIGVVVHLEPAQPVRNKNDWQMLLYLRDPTLQPHQGPGFGLKIKFFAPSGDMPKVELVGDVVLLQSVKPNYWAGEFSLLSDKYKTTTMVFPSARIPHTSAALEVAYTQPGLLTRHLTPDSSRIARGDEQLYVISLHQWFLDNQSSLVRQNFNINDAPTAPSAMRAPTAPSSMRTPTQPNISRNRDALIKDVEDARFFDLIGEVVKIYSPGSQSADLYITDYTTNPFLFDYGAPEDQAGRDGDQYGYTPHQPSSKWTGPLGKMTLQVRAWPPHCYFVTSNLKVGDFVKLQNVKIKYQVNKLEGSLHGDQKYPDKIYVTKCEPSWATVQPLLERKENYLNEFTASGQAMLKPKEEKKSNRQRKLERKAKQEEEKAKKQGTTAMAKTSYPPSRHVKSGHLDVPTMKISEILNNPNLESIIPDGSKQQLPFINMKCRAHVRVVDFDPPELEDFSRSLDDPSWAGQAGSTGGWQWAFRLLVEDATVPEGETPVRMCLIVHDKNAEFLLKLDATDLRQDSRTLALLREKLFLLWGPLEEDKSKGINPLSDSSYSPKNTPFECGIMEYGITNKATSRLQRMHQMFTTTIGG